MKDTTYHAVHDHNGNIKSFYVTTSSFGAQVTMTPEPGCSVSQVNLPEQLKIPGELKLTKEEDANQLLELMKQYRVDTSTVGTLIKKPASQK